MKTCSICDDKFIQTVNQEKKREGVCLSCRRKRDATWRRSRRLAGTPVISTKMPREYHTQYEKTYRQKPDVIFKNRMRAKTRDAVRRGKLQKGLCEFCNSQEVEAHHDDYSKPLEVRWLCKAHHNHIHLKYAEAE